MAEELTKFTEANALLAVLAGETEEAGSILGAMLPGELRTLEYSAHILARMCYERTRQMRAGAAPAEGGQE